MSNLLKTPTPEKTYLAQTDKYITRIGGANGREYLTKTGDDSTIPHFTKFVEDGAYAEALSGKVIQCVDIMVFDPDAGQVLLGRRDQEPHSGDWIIGGAMRAGETSAETATRHMRRELHTDIDPTRLSEVGNYKFIWDSRAQGPTKNEAGDDVVSCHMSSTLESYPVDKDSVDLEQFNEEYAEIKWVDIIDVVDAPEGTYHPCLVDMVNDLLDKQTTPEAPKTTQEAIDRHMGAIAYLKAKERRESDK
jgi:ADP-ribose pyrophosphatase YjhB (NUDIX family)